MNTKVANRRGVALTWSVLLVTSLLLAIPATSSAAALKCDGKTPTITGTNGDDVIEGTDGPDIIHAKDGNDIVTGGDSRDIICGGDGDDELRGGKGGDTLIGGDGQDLIVGNAGNDTLDGGPKSDELIGNDGDDTIRGGSGADNADGGKGDDTIKGASGKDTLIGGPQNDAVDGGSGTDRCSGNTETSCEGKVIDFKVKRFLINQAVPAADSKQSAGDRTETVAGRPGVVRVFISANQNGIDAPLVNLYVEQKNGTITRYKMTGPNKVPKKPSEADMNSTFNLEFDENFLKAGMKMYVKVDRKGNVFELDEDNNRYPDSGFTNIKATKVPKMKITVVRAQGHSMSKSEAIALFQKTFQVHPVANWDIEMRPGKYTCQGCVGGPSFNNWITLLNEIRDLQVADPDDRMYHAIVPWDYGASIGVGGLGYVGGWPAAVSIPNDETIAHETGHNLSLLHIGCGGPDPNSIDYNYPYATDSIGKWGYNPATGDTYDPDVFVDLMTYCSPEWISDYHFDKGFDYRMASGYDVVARGLADSGTGTVMEFTGTLQSDAKATASYELIPQAERFDVAIPTEISSVLAVDGPARPPAPGAQTMVGRDAAGAVVVAVSFEAYAYDHAPGSTFKFSVEISPENLSRVATWQVEAITGEVVTSRVAR